VGQRSGLRAGDAVVETRRQEMLMADRNPDSSVGLMLGAYTIVFAACIGLAFLLPANVFASVHRGFCRSSFIYGFTWLNNT
jgi:hypothetical protein